MPFQGTRKYNGTSFRYSHIFQHLLDKCITMEADGVSEGDRQTWKEVEDKNVNDLHLKQSDVCH